MNMIWSPNPRKRRRRKMSAKQRKFFGKRKHRRSAKSVAAAPVVHHRRRRARRSSASSGSRRRSRRSFSSGFSRSGAMALLKTGVVGGAGAVLVDVAMGQAVPFLPASMATPKDATGAVNYGYYGVKAALAIALGTYGKRLPVVGKYADEMAAGAMTVLAYGFLRPMVPANINLGAYFNPRTNVRGMGAYTSPAIAVRRRQGVSGPGARSANVLSFVGNHGARVA